MQSNFETTAVATSTGVNEETIVQETSMDHCFRREEGSVVRVADYRFKGSWFVSLN